LRRFDDSPFQGDAHAIKDLGANEFTFTGDQTKITYYPTAPGPVVVGKEGGLLEYEGIEGILTFRGDDEVRAVLIDAGAMVSVTLKADRDKGSVLLTLVVPSVTGVTREKPVTLEALALKATTRGFSNGPGPDRTYTIVPLLGSAMQAILPL
jgi:hypothetical protein